MQYVILALLVLAPIGIVIDYDADGIITAQEWTLGTSPVNRDSDGDGLPDGWEKDRETSPSQADTDDDGLHDGDEWRLGTQPLNPDMDQDGVLDGAEGARICIELQDCDQDALADGLEVDGFDPLRSDSFGTGLDDGVVWLFAQQGLPATGDEDKDGIPDGWETAGLIDWGPFSPQPGRRDLLIEFLKVTGPSSGRFALDFTPAYSAVATMFANNGIYVQWVETPVSLPAEYRPGFLGETDADYFEEVLREGQGSTNPYVTSVLLNPQQVQEDLRGQVLGAAFLRSMIATVDYGAHTTIFMDQADAEGIVLNGSMKLSPSLESNIIGARAEQVSQLAFAKEGVVDLGVESNGDLFLITLQDGEEYRWSWTPDWFKRAPRITNGDAYLQLKVTDARIATGSLATTIAHELGHTLGLCHAHEPACFEAFSPQDVTARDTSTMSYQAPPGTLRFLPSEWQQVERFLTCPPQEPLLVLAAGGDIYLAKYVASFDAGNVRLCQEAVVIQPDLNPSALQTNPAGVGWVVAYALGSGAILAVILAYTICQRRLY